MVSIVFNHLSANLVGQGDGAPTHVHPYCLQHKDSTRSNVTQRSPYITKEHHHYHEEYTRFCSAMEEVFQWIAKKVCLYYTLCTVANFNNIQIQSHFPEVYGELEMVAEALPGGQHHPQHPFSGLVININACSESHRDQNDFIACLVLPIGDFEGGELCLYEPGVVLPLQNGDIVFFLSFDITHFNLPYTGRRASMVLHTDKGGQRWKENMGHWQDNVYAPN